MSDRGTIQSLYAVINLCSFVSKVEHRESRDWATGAAKVEFRVTSSNLSLDVMAGMQQDITQMLEAVRPAGIQFVVAVVPEDSEDIRKRFPPPPQSTSPTAERLPPPAIVARNRFAAVSEELSEDAVEPISGLPQIIENTTKRIASIYALPEEMLRPGASAVSVETKTAIDTETYDRAAKSYEPYINSDLVAAVAYGSDFQANVIGVDQVNGVVTLDQAPTLMSGDVLVQTVTVTIDGETPPRSRVVSETTYRSQDDYLADTIERMRTRLGLEPFTLFAAKQRDRNMRNNLSERDWIRQTGRTTFGLVNALAKCVVQNSRYLYVVSGSAKRDAEIIYRATLMRTRLGETCPQTIMRYVNAMGVKDSTDVVTYTDHGAI